MAKRDYYDVLGVNKNSSSDQIKSAYRKLAVKYHPDKNKGDKAAEEKFKEASEAYHVLSNNERKQNYDNFGHAAFENGGGARGGFGNFDFSSSFSDIFEDFFGEGFGGGNRRSKRSNYRGSDLRYDLTIDLEDAYSGKKEDIKFTTSEKCENCSGSGSKPGYDVGRCSMCSGHGQVRSSQGFFTVQQTCPQCSGSGRKLLIHVIHVVVKGKNKHLKDYLLRFQRGLMMEQELDLQEKVKQALGAGNGDLYLFINVNSHDLFKRQDEHLFFECPISIADAALGSSIEIPTIDGGKAKIKIPPGTQSGKQFRLRGKGMPHMRGNSVGDLYVQVNTEVPISLNKEQKELLEKFREIENEKSNPSIKKFFQKAKSFWKN